ncbi:SRPBCC family protein [Arachidicoccus soli]|uniref:Cell division inhibitor n=1 Tax=Arachidicoccus soli TaxID=2341117 RepID=A0A386HQ85_9BACT|nr:SRPBCC family protein [Arachidicoccus soli]AYD47829.1 hypothetical protein D6B99_09655 [Arachidicoccus soli]
MKIYTLNKEQFLPISLDKAWHFFSSAGNLSKITPPEMQFKVLTKFEQDDIFEGMHIDYIVRPLFNIPLRWKTEILKVDKPNSFIDKQLNGPYKLWEHTHIFIEKENGVLMKDQLKYSLPFGIIGRLGHAILVREKIEKIFEFRKLALNKIFK